MTAKRDRNPKTSAAFTLIELLVVISILGVLVGILGPSLGQARILAKIASTRALVNTLDTAVRTFQSEARLGGAYPPSNWPGTDMPRAGTTGSATGAQTLVWAVCGADMLGTAGFNTAVAPMNQLYNLDASNKPVYPRTGPFIEPSKLTLMTLDDPRLLKGATGGYDTAKCPVIVDPFNNPILYFKADLAGTNVIDPTGIYHLDDNKPFLNNATAGTIPAASITDTRGTGKWNAVDKPYNADSFILYSASADGIYGPNPSGTNDDVTNFVRP